MCDELRSDAKTSAHANELVPARALPAAETRRPEPLGMAVAIMSRQKLGR